MFLQVYNDVYLWASILWLMFILFLHRAHAGGLIGYMEYSKKYLFEYHSQINCFRLSRMRCFWRAKALSCYSKSSFGAHKLVLERYKATIARFSDEKLFHKTCMQWNASMSDHKIKRGGILRAIMAHLTWVLFLKKVMDICFWKTLEFFQIPLCSLLILLFSTLCFGKRWDQNRVRMSLYTLYGIRSLNCTASKTLEIFLCKKAYIPVCFC